MIVRRGASLVVAPRGNDEHGGDRSDASTVGDLEADSDGQLALVVLVGRWDFVFISW